MRRISLNTTLTAPFLPLLLELPAVFRKNSLRSLSSRSKTAVTSAAFNSRVKQFTTNPSITFNAQVCSNAVLKSPTTSSILKASSAGRLFEQKFYGLFEHMSLAFESTSLQRQRSFHAQSIADGSIVITFTLWLDYENTTGSSGQDIIKWSCLIGISYLFLAFWFDSSMQWVGMITTYGMRVLIDPINLAGFLASVFGLFLIAIFGLISTLPAIKKLPVKLSLRRIGATMMALGGYFVFGILLYVFAGGFAERPFAWYEMIVPHNPYLWCVAFLITGLPLLVSDKISRLELRLPKINLFRQSKGL